MVWLPTLHSSISVLSNLAIISVPMDCPTPSMRITACPYTMEMETHCVSTPVSSLTETYLQGLISCTLYNFSLDINNNTIWRVQRSTAVNLQASCRCLSPKYRRFRFPQIDLEESMPVIFSCASRAGCCRMLQDAVKMTATRPRIPSSMRLAR